MRFRVKFSYLFFRNNIGFAGKGTIALSDVALLISGDTSMFGVQLTGSTVGAIFMTPTLRTVPYARVNDYTPGWRTHKLTYTPPDGKRVVVGFRFPDGNGQAFAARLEEYRLTMRSLYLGG